MYEVVKNIKFGLSFFVTSYGLVAWIILVTLLACYLFLICGKRITITKIIRLVMYPFLFIIGAFLYLVAQLVENSSMRIVGACMLIMLLLFEVIVFDCFRFRKHRKGNL